MAKNAVLYRMVMEKHVCPFGLRAKHLLQRQGYEVDDHHLTTRQEVDQFKQQHDVATTPQVFIDDNRIGGFDELVAFLGVRTLKQEGKTYQPIIAIFSVTFCMALALSHTVSGSLNTSKIIELFIALSMCVLGIMKLRDLFSFTNQFLSYDLIARRWLPYATLYPFLETGAGILMLGHLLIPLAASIALFIGIVGCLSVAKAVWIDQRDLRCACVGGDSHVPLGLISFTENIMMVLIAIWMMIKFHFIGVFV